MDSTAGTGVCEAMDEKGVTNFFQRYFADKKYVLLRQFQKCDRGNTGHLDEETFMDAILTVNSRVCDEDQLRFALFFFKHPSARVSYRDVMQLCLR